MVQSLVFDNMVYILAPKHVKMVHTFLFHVVHDCTWACLDGPVFGVTWCTGSTWACLDGPVFGATRCTGKYLSMSKGPAFIIMIYMYTVKPSTLSCLHGPAFGAKWSKGKYLSMCTEKEPGPAFGAWCAGIRTLTSLADPACGATRCAC